MSEKDWFVLRTQPLSGHAKSGSPDIILGGETPNPKYTSNYDSAFNASANFSAANYVYVRAQNSAGTQSIGSVMVYAVRQNNVQNQTNWLTIQTADGRDSTNISADAGAVGVNGAALVWRPGAAPPPDAPWMLIAEIVGDGHPKLHVPKTVTDLATFNVWLGDQTRIAALTVQPPVVKPVVRPSFTWSREVDLGNEAPITLDVSVTCTSGPSGGSLAYQFDKNDSQNQSIVVGATAYDVNAAYSQSRTVDAGFASTLTLTYTPPADETGQAAFAVQVATESGGGDGGGDLSDTTKTLFVNDALTFAQTRGDV